MGIVNFSVKNRVPVNLLLMVMIAGGVIGYHSMPREVFPVVSIDRVAVSTVYSGVSPEEIEKNITIPIEKAIKGIKGIAHIESSSLEGTSLIEAELEPGRDMKRVAEDIRSRIERIETLPEEADDPMVIEIEFEAPVVMLGISGPVREMALRDIADQLEYRIDQIDGVGSVTLGGYRDREIWIEVDPNRMYPFGIGIREVIQALKERNLDLAGGRLKGKREELLLRTVGEFQDVSDVNNMVVRENPLGRHIRLLDIGSARLTYEEEEDYGRINEERSITLNITKGADGDAITIMEGIEAELEDLQKNLPTGIEISLTQNSAIWVQSRLRTLYFNGTIGFTLVCLTLFTFLNWRMALWTAVGIPASFLGALFLMSLLGQSINMLSLFALIVVLGMVVDDAIIVTENVYRHISMGYTPIRAAVIGTEQVLMPVLATVVTTVAAFIPMLMMSGILGKFMRVIPIVVTLVLVMSLLEALVILPSHLADFSRPLPSSGSSSNRDGAWFIRLRRRYQKTLVSVLRKRYWFVIGIVVVAAGLMAFAYQSGKFVLFGVKDIPGFVVMLETPTGTKLEETSRRVAEVEQRIATLRAEDINAVVSLIGRQLDPETNRTRKGSHLGQVIVELADFESPNRRNGYEVLAEMREKIVGLTGLKSLKVEPIEGGPPVGAAIEMTIRGEDLEQLRSISDEVQDFLVGIPGVLDIRDDYARGKKEIQFRIDPARAAIYGLDTAAVAQAVRASFHGETATRIRRDDETIDIVVKFAEPYRNDPRYLEQLQVANARGILVPIKSVAVLRLHEGVNAINRKDHRRTVTVSADVDTEIITSREVSRMIEARFGDLNQTYPGYDFHFGGETEEQRKSMASLLKAYTITALIIYTILGGLFQSFLQPIVVMFAVPFGIIGVIIGHFVMGQALSLLSLIGVVALSGIVVNDSLLLVDFINKAREKGRGRWRSIVVSGQVRMRPILLTTLTTVLGLATLSFQTKGQAGYLAPMAISIVWGLLFATGLTLFLVPALFAIGDDLVLFVKRRWGRSS
ncbi:efflux RND transporter permease subunit [bacterium AH-315-L15]|nr:efflux RND transporter permease subunit [bacterium AH-315-L15]